MRCATAALFLATMLCMSVPAADFQQKWLYFGPNIESPEKIDEAIEILKTAKAAGCTHVLNSGSTHLRLDSLTDGQLADIERFKAAVDELGLVMIPAVFPTGYGGRYLNFDNSLAAGIPVKNKTPGRCLRPKASRSWPTPASTRPTATTSRDGRGRPSRASIPSSTRR